MSKKVLIIDDEENLRHILSIILKKEGYETFAVKNGLDALSCLDKAEYDLILCDIRMPVMDGISFLKKMCAVGRSVSDEESVHAVVIMMSAYGTVDDAVEAMKLGAYDYISKPFKPDEVILTIRKAEERERLRKENRELRKAIRREYSESGIITKNQDMQDILTTIKKIADYKTTVLITGDSGTGKELLARALHYNSKRNNKSFVAVNCGAIPENLLESELFGHVKGAFTDAIRTKKGLFEEAEGGTLFLDEIGELPLHLQVKLLRVLQEEEVLKVGDTKPVKVDVRIVAATVKDLAREVKAGLFREDLYYRLNIMAIKIPPLRERKEDIPALAAYFLERYGRKHGIKSGNITTEVMKILIDYDWPGNIRELENCVERCILLSEGKDILPATLPVEVRDWNKPPETMTDGLSIHNRDYSGLSIKKMERYLEEDLIRKALEKTGGNRTRAAELLEISNRALLYKMKEFGL